MWRMEWNETNEHERQIVPNSEFEAGITKAFTGIFVVLWMNGRADGLMISPKRSSFSVRRAARHRQIGWFAYVAEYTDINTDTDTDTGTDTDELVGREPNQIPSWISL